MPTEPTSWDAPRPGERRSGPLAGIVVIDASRALAGPHAAMMLGDLGARVIKVEAPRGDDSRRWGPPFITAHDGTRESTYFFSANRNKESMTLDLKDRADALVFGQLLERADVLVENFRPGAMARLGFSYADIADMNPRLVALSITGFGHDGPEATRAGYDQIAQGEGGLMSLTGRSADDPQRTGVPIADLLAGLYGAFGVLAALREREVTGRGQVVRTSLLAAVVGAHAFHGTAWTVAGDIGHANGNHHPSIAPYGLFRCKNGAIQIACGSESLWRRLCTELDIEPEQAGMASNEERVANRDRLIQMLEDRFADSDSNTLLDRLSRAGVPTGRVRTLDEVYSWEQTATQNLLIDVAHETLGQITLPGPPLRFFAIQDGAEYERTRDKHIPPPVLGSANERIRAWLAEPPTA